MFLFWTFLIPAQIATVRLERRSIKGLKPALKFAFMAKSLTDFQPFSTRLSSSVPRVSLPVVVLPGCIPCKGRLRAISSGAYRRIQFRSHHRPSSPSTQLQTRREALFEILAQLFGGCVANNPTIRQLWEAFIPTRRIGVETNEAEISALFIAEICTTHVGLVSNNQVRVGRLVGWDVWGEIRIARFAGRYPFCLRWMGDMDESWQPYSFRFG